MSLSVPTKQGDLLVAPCHGRLTAKYEVEVDPDESESGAHPYGNVLTETV